MSAEFDCDVLICGFGPVGQLLALLLGDLGVETIAVDEADEPYELPRAAVIDDEVLRIFQAVGLDQAVLRDAQVQRTVSFVNNRGRKIEVLRPAEGDLGHPPLVSIHQPSMERTMVAAAAERAVVDIRWSTRIETVDQGGRHVDVWVRPTAGGRALRLRAQYAIACDGGRSLVRRNLEIAFGGSTFAQRWLVVDALIDEPLVKVPHPHFVGDVDRPTVSLPMSPGRHRWEFMVHPGEDSAPFERPDRIRELMAPYVGDEQIELERAVVYTFHVRRAARWRAGRVLLAGDAAHLTPPFVGQGFSSGARDAQNLAWKLDAVLRGAPSRLLDTYETERRPHVKAMQDLAVRWGGVVQTRRPATGRFRDTVLAGLEHSGALDWIKDRAKPLPTCGAGAFATTPARLPFRRQIGALFPQPDRLDESLGLGWSVVARTDDAAERWREQGIHAIVRRRDEWLSGRGLDWALLRPDRFVFACGGDAEFGPGVAALRFSIGAGVRSAAPTTKQVVAA
jgi:3-(3-hydroxy-phenyl)propionate hydroxylase